MDTDNLVHMANRIGQFFESFSDRDEALAGVAGHIHKFWEPRMRGALLAHWRAAGENSGLRPIVGEALERHQAELA